MPLFTLNNWGKSRTDLQFTHVHFNSHNLFSNSTLDSLKRGFPWQVNPMSVIESGPLVIWVMLKRFIKKGKKPRNSAEELEAGGQIAED